MPHSAGTCLRHCCCSSHAHCMFHQPQSIRQTDDKTHIIEIFYMELAATSDPPDLTSSIRMLRGPTQYSLNCPVSYNPTQSLKTTHPIHRMICLLISSPLFLTLITMRRYQLRWVVFCSALRLSNIAPAVAPGTAMSSALHRRPWHTLRSFLRFASYSSLRLLPQTSVRDADLVFAFLHNFSSLVKEISENPRNFVALRRLDSVLQNVERLDCATLVFVVQGLCRIRKLQRAINVMKEMKSRFEKVSDYFLYSVVFDCLVRDGRLDEVEIVWNDVCGNQTVIDVSGYVLYVCKFGDSSVIKRMCQRILKDGKVLRSQSYAALVGALCRHGEGSLAKAVIHAMDHAGMGADDLTYFVMYQCYCRNGDLVDADWILRRLIQRGFEMDVTVYGSFLHGLCKSGKFREADKLFRKLLRNDTVKSSSEADFMRLGRRAIFQLDPPVGDVSVVMAYEAYFRSLCSVGRLDEAQELFKEMLRMRTVPQTCVHACFIKALFKAGRDSDAVKFFNLEKKKQHICTDEILGSLVKGLCEGGRVDDGLKMLNEVILKGVFFNGTSVCNNILGSFWKENKVMEAETLFNRMNGGACGLADASTYSIMIQGFCQQGNITKALSLFSKMLGSKISISRVPYENVISELFHQGRLIEAHRLLNNMLENGRVVSFDEWDRVFHSYMTS